MSAIFAEITQNKIKLASVIKNKDCRILYRSENYQCFISKLPQMQALIDKLIISGDIGTHDNEEYLIYSCLTPETLCFSELYCFIILDKESINNYKMNISKCYHDIQEPLRSISNLLQLLSKQNNIRSDGESFKYISYAMDNVEKLKEWTSEFLVTSTNNKQPEFSTSLSIAIEEIQSLLKFQMDHRNCCIKVENCIPNIPCEKSLVLRIFKNLIENSLKHAITGDLNLCIEVYQDKIKSTENEIVLIFKDNGTLIQSKPHSDSHNIGLGMISDMMLSIGGKIRNISENNGYNKFELVFPK